jgi:hypothetical protein
MLPFRAMITAWECDGASSPRRQGFKKGGGIGVSHGDSQLIPVAGLPKIRINATKRRLLKENGIIQASKVARGCRAAELNCAGIVSPRA